MRDNSNDRSQEQGNRSGIPPKNGSRRAIPHVPEPSQERLHSHQIIHYRNHRREFINWMDTVGKNPQKKKSYAHETVRRRARDCDAFYRWVWDQEGEYTTKISTDHGDAFLEKLVDEDYSESHKANFEKSLKCLFRWLESEWDPVVSFGMGKRHFQPRDYLSREEREQLCSAARDYGRVPSFDDLSEEERSKYENELGRRFRKPAEEIERSDFEKANGSRLASLFHVSLDAALRPIEVARARLSWVDLDNKVLRIPHEDSSKGSENWVIALRELTSQLLGEWLDERAEYPAYSSSSRLWLTRDGNPYSSHSLNYMLQNLCEEAGIDAENRSVTWYSLRTSTATYIAREDGLESASHQLRHKSLGTTRKYDIVPPDERREALENI